MTKKKVNRDDLIYRYKDKSSDKKFDKYNNALDIINKTINGKIKLEDLKNDQEIFKSHLGGIRKGSNKKKSKQQKNTMQNVEMLYISRNEAINYLMNML